MYTEEQIDKIKELGNEWQKGGHHRVYFNDLGTLYGIETGRYNTGNISSATLDGEKISNSQAKRLLQKLFYVKVWFDLTDGQFHHKDTYGEINAEMRPWVATDFDPGQIGGVTVAIGSDVEGRAVVGCINS